MSWDWDKLREQQEKYQNKGTSPNFDLNSFSPKFDNFMGGFKNFHFTFVLLILIGLFILFFGSSMFYTVGVDEVGVIQRFGKYTRETPPGLHFKLPKGIEDVTLVKTQRVYKEEFGIKTSQFSRVEEDANENEALMLTGDLNVAIVPWIVQYKIHDPYKFLFKVKDPTQLLKDLSEASMRLVVGDRSINEVISKREEIAIEAQRVLQQDLNDAETGIRVVTIEMKKTNVPKQVQPSFNEVNQAIQEKEQVIYKAKEVYNKAIPEAKGKAEKMVKTAEGYATKRINNAEGDASRFLAVYKEYVKAKDVTRKRIYLESLKEIFKNFNSIYIVDENQKNFLPMLNVGGEGLPIKKK